MPTKHRETAALGPLLQDLSLMNQYIQKMAGTFQSGSLSIAQYQPKSLNWKDFHEEISNPNPKSGQSIIQDMAEGAIEGAGKAVGDTWDRLKSAYELGRTIMGPFSPLYLGSELLFNRDQLLENQRKHQEFYLGIINDPIGKVRKALDMPKYIWSAVTSAWERDVVNGDAKSRTAFFTYGLTSLGIGILGDKGIGKAGTIAKTVRLAGKGEKAFPIYTPVQTPAVARGLVQGPVPYNVLFDPLTKIKTVTEDVYGGKVRGNPLLPKEGKVGKFKELAKQGTAFDNITPHHMPSAAKMKQAEVKRNDGVSMNMEQPHPGVGGRHRETYTYGLNGIKLEEYLRLSYRDALAHDFILFRLIYNCTCRVPQ
ncbi:hypothetical protein KIS1582_3435 [Cytobacillus firmus]|uniref:Uncharacterized protein n=2 Tax=Cytobacillus firmus TaxID=1399 RepID=A0A800N9D1_CYTFI|nr:hypothetical protein [Cytobacillus firmus]KAF0822742.1 hypothetical protein KIS1582_3435 [Cytobacillus firmus]